MAFQQPLVPVLPVARELFSKTKLIASKGATQLDPRPSHRGRITTDDTIRDRRPRRSSSSGIVPPGSSEFPNESVLKLAVTEEPEFIAEESTANNDSGSSHRRGRARLLSLFGKKISPGSPYRSNVSVLVETMDTYF